MAGSDVSHMTSESNKQAGRKGETEKNLIVLCR